MASIQLVSALGILVFISFASLSECASKRMKDSFVKRETSCEIHPCSDGCNLTEVCDEQGCCQSKGSNLNGTCIACQSDDQCSDMPNLCVGDCCAGTITISTTTTTMP